MADDTPLILDTAESPNGPAPRFDVPDFMVPKSLADVHELARMIALAGWAPDSYRDCEGNYVQQKIELAIMHGSTVGLGPIAALQSIAVIDGMPTIWGDGALSIVERSGLLDDMLEEYETHPEEGLVAICTMRRRRRPTPIVNRFSMAMAEEAHLLRKEGPWQLYPQRMLKMRARSWTLRDGFADVLRGLHIREEVDDFAETRVVSAPGASRQGPLPILTPRRGSPQANGTAPEFLSVKRRGDAQSMGEGRANSMNQRTMATPSVWAEAGNEPDPSTIERATSPAALIDAAKHIAAPTTIDAHLAATDNTTSERFTFVDAEGEFIEVDGAEALRAALERLFFNKELSRDQIIVLWQANNAARAAIERQFGSAALEKAAERVHNVQDERGQHTPKRAGEVQDAAAPRNSSRSPDDNKPTPPEAEQGTRGNRACADSELQVRIGPGWGDKKVLRRYRAALMALCNRCSGTSSEIARFRAANAALESRLRRKLPDRMAELDFLHTSAMQP